MNEITLTMLGGAFLVTICYVMYKKMPWVAMYDNMKNFVNGIISKVKGLVGK